jgi:flagellar hook assembly protein FlgD
MLGREIKTLINSEMAAGKYSVEWKGDNDKGNPVATGVYIYRITADKFAAVKKMLLLK